MRTKPYLFTTEPFRHLKPSSGEARDIAPPAVEGFAWHLHSWEVNPASGVLLLMWEGTPTGNASDTERAPELARRCDECEAWAPTHADAEGCVWGNCDMMPHPNVVTVPAGPVRTHEAFGCKMWRPEPGQTFPLHLDDDDTDEPF